MDFHSLPYDTQRCVIEMGTWREDGSEIILNFRDGEAIQVAPNLEETEWLLKKTSGTAWMAGDNQTWSESMLWFEFDLERNAAFYETFVIIPVVFFVFIAWLSFFIQRSVAPARVTLSIIS